MRNIEIHAMKAACFIHLKSMASHKNCFIISHDFSTQTSIRRCSELSLHTNSFLLQMWQIKLPYSYKACDTLFLQKCQKGFANACVVILSKHSDTQRVRHTIIYKLQYKLPWGTVESHGTTSGWIPGWLIIPPREWLHLCNYGVDKMSLCE